MKTVKQIRAEIREHKQYMKEAGIKQSSFMNRQPSAEASRANERLFALKCALENAQKSEREFCKAFTPNQYGEYA